MAGYDGFSMSNNAREAYREGERPLSKWTKEDILKGVKKCVNEEAFKILKGLSLTVLRKYALYKSSWHHTSSYYNRTNFYSIDEDYLSTLSNSELQRLQEENEYFKKKKKAVKKVKSERRKVKAHFVEWEWHAKKSKAIDVEEIGFIDDTWFYRWDGSKKRIKAKGFKVIEYLD